MSEVFSVPPHVLFALVPRWVWLAYAALIGLTLGSFCNVLVYRLPRDLSLWPRSACPQCARRIAWYDNIPAASFVLLQGRCRRCRGRIAWRYPAIELAVAALWVGAVLRFGATMEAFGIAAFATSLVPVTLIDLESLSIPDALNAMVFLNGLCNAAYGSVGVLTSVTLSSALVAATVGFGFFGAIVLITRGGMGTGDVFLAAGLGANLGLAGLAVAVWCAAILGGVISVALIATKIRRVGQPIPYGPFLCAGALIVAYGGTSSLLALAGLYGWR